MSQMSPLQYGYLAYFSRPAADRLLYRAVRRQGVRRIVEIGMGDGRRAVRMIRVAQGFSPGAEISYAGIDQFEARPADQPRISLKAAYTQLRRLTSAVKLAPGDPYTALARTANALGQADLVVIAADQDEEQLAQAWIFVPRLLHAETLIYREEVRRPGGRSRFVRLDCATVHHWADLAQRRLRSAA